MKKSTAIEGAFETPAQMIEAICVRRTHDAQVDADEERLAEEAAISDPEVAAWVRAAEAEDAAAAYRTLVSDLYGQQKIAAA